MLFASARLWVDRGGQRGQRRGLGFAQGGRGGASQRGKINHETCLWLTLPHIKMRHLSHFLQRWFRKSSFFKYLPVLSRTRTQFKDFRWNKQTEMGVNFQLNCTLLIALQAKIYIFSQISATRTLKPFLRLGVPLIRPRRLCELPDSCCTHWGSRGLNGGGTQTHPFNFSKNDNNRSWKDCIPRLEV